MNIDNSNIFFKIVWYLFFGIGYLIIYKNYFFPTEWGKNRNTAITSRQIRHKHLFGPFYALLIWLFVIAFIYTGLQEA